jgi:hypothetical protein
LGEYGKAWEGYGKFPEGKLALELVNAYAQSVGKLF